MLELKDCYVPFPGSLIRVDERRGGVEYLLLEFFLLRGGMLQEVA